jgi:hypothetical protein
MRGPAEAGRHPCWLVEGVVDREPGLSRERGGDKGKSIRRSGPNHPGSGELSLRKALATTGSRYRLLAGIFMRLGSRRRTVVGSFRSAAPAAF